MLDVTVMGSGRLGPKKKGKFPLITTFLISPRSFAFRTVHETLNYTCLWASGMRLHRWSNSYMHIWLPQVENYMHIPGKQPLSLPCVWAAEQAWEFWYRCCCCMHSVGVPGIYNWPVVSNPFSFSAFQAHTLKFYPNELSERLSGTNIRLSQPGYWTAAQKSCS